MTQFLEFLNPLVADLGRSERRIAATRYVEGLLMPGQRKSIIPMAERLGVDSQSLQQFITDSPWSEEDVWRAIRQEMIPHLEPLEAWVVDETGWVKQGSHSVGVSHQYCGAVGKQANCQVSLEVVVTNGWIAAPVAGRLYLPEGWTQDRERCQAAGVPEEVEFRTKPQLALEMHGTMECLQRRSWGIAPMATTRTFVPGCAPWRWSFFCKLRGPRSKVGTTRCGQRSSGFAVPSVRANLPLPPWRT